MLRTRSTGVPRAIFCPARGLCSITSPSGTVSLGSSFFSPTFKPASTSTSSAAAEVRPASSGAGTGAGPSPTSSTTFVPFSASWPAGIDWAITLPASSSELSRKVTSASKPSPINRCCASALSSPSTLETSFFPAKTCWASETTPSGWRPSESDNPQPKTPIIPEMPTRAAAVRSTKGRHRLRSLTATRGFGKMPVGASCAARAELANAGSSPRLVRRKSSTTSEAFAYRSSGFLASSFALMAFKPSGTPRFLSPREGAGSLTCFIDTAIGVSASKGTRPVSISWRTTPREYRSLRGPAALPITCSGDM